MGLISIDNAKKAVELGKKINAAYKGGQGVPSSLTPVNPAAQQLVKGPAPANKPPVRKSAPIRKPVSRPAPQSVSMTTVVKPAAPAPEKTTYTIFGKEYSRTGVNTAAGVLFLSAAIGYLHHRSHKSK